jgi:hypothetical protein
MTQGKHGASRLMAIGAAGVDISTSGSQLETLDSLGGSSFYHVQHVALIDLRGR